MAIGAASAVLFVGGYAAVTDAGPAQSNEAAVQVEMGSGQVVPGGGAAEQGQKSAITIAMPPGAAAPPAQEPQAAREEHPASAAPMQPGREAPASAPGVGADPGAEAEGPSAPPAGAAAAAAERASRLREENRMLGEARDALRRGDAAGALARLEEVRARFPDGEMIQEREALAIDALYRTGQRAAASARAAAFLRAYPTSPHATRIQGFVQ
jgi:hypothetical protein